MKKNLIKKFILLLKAKYKLSKPPTKNIIIFDIPLIKKINLNLGIRKKDSEILYIRGEVLNIYVIFKTLFEIKFKFQDYIKNYIKIVNPKIVITFIDNSFFFYTLKKSFPNIKFISVQNGYRNRTEEISNTFKKVSQKLEVDYFFSFGESIGKEYSKFIKLKNKILGSFRNNIVPISKIYKKKNNLLYISQFRDQNINLPEYFNIEKKLLPLVLRYCEKFNLKLNILGSQKYPFDSEYQFYEKIIGLKKYNFIKNKIFPQNYKELDKFDTIIFVDSTLGYEAIARGNKVAVFSARKRFQKGKISNFGWPKKINQKGFFYTNAVNQKEVFRILNNVYFCSKYKWDKLVKYNYNDIIKYNYENRILKQLIQNLLKI